MKKRLCAQKCDETITVGIGQSRIEILANPAEISLQEF